jgi:ABC-type sugar transport system permease subunit/ABC-type glycerol-3-phosphate transport system substrate-binding protein
MGYPKLKRYLKAPVLSLLCFLPLWTLSQPVTLRLSTWEGTGGIEVIQKTVADFEKAHPNIKVKLEKAGWRDYSNKLLIQYAANSAPDVASMNTIYYYKFASRGALLNLNPFIKATPDFDLKSYYPIALENLQYKGSLYVLPRDVSPIFILYNKKLFDRAGLPYPDGSWTWDYRVRPHLKEKDFLWVLQQLSKLDKNRKPVQWGICAYTAQYLADNFALASGGQFANKPENPTKVLYNDPKVIRAFQFTADLANKEHYLPNYSELRHASQTMGRDIWLAQKAAMYLTGTWDIPKIRKALIPNEKGWFEWDIVAFPGYKDGTKRYLSATNGYGILKSTRYPKESWELVKWLSGEPGMKRLVESGLAHPAIKSIALSEPWLPGPHTPLEQQYPPSRIRIHEAVQYSWNEPKSEFWQQSTAVIHDKLSLLWDGQISAAKLLGETNIEAQRLLDKALEKKSLPNFKWSYALIMGVCCVTALLFWVYWPERQKVYSRLQKRESRVAYAFLSPWILGASLFVLLPMLLSLMISVTDWDIIQPARWMGIGNYTEALSHDPRFWTVVHVTLVYTVLAVPLGVVIALLLALLLNVKVKGMPLFRAIFYLPSLASVVASALIWRKIFQTEGGLLNTLIYGADGQGNFLGLATLLSKLTHSTKPVNWLGDENTALLSLIIMSVWGVGASMIILLAGLQHIPQAYSEAAVIDGAGRRQRFQKIILPLLGPSLLFCMVTGVISSFQVFTKAFVMTLGGPGDATRFFVLYLYNQAFDYLRMGYASALAWILFLIILVFTLIQFKMGKSVYYEGEGQDHIS